MKHIYAKIGLITLTGLLVWGGMAFAAGTPNLAARKIEIERGYTEEAAKCIECHAEKTPGIYEDWKLGRMANAGVSCYDCHMVESNSPMASQCPGLKGTKIFISPMVSSKTCSRCHPSEVDEFLKSGHADLSRAAVYDKNKAGGGLVKLQNHYEGAAFLGVEDGSLTNQAARTSGCKVCHGSVVELGPDNKPINNTWPGGVGTLYPDGSVGTCTVCHTRHRFSVAEARKPEACASCHLGPDHPDIEIYHESKHGQIFLTEGEEWKWDSAPGTWQPGDYRAPTCATCHMSGIGELQTTHNVNERLKWDLMHKKSVIRSGVRGDGEKGDKLMRKVCINCHSSSSIDQTRQTLDSAVALYNTYWDEAVKMKKELAEKGLLGKDPWDDGFQELMYYLWHHTGRRARQGTAMFGPDYAHWHGFFQVFQVVKDMQAIYNWRLKNNKIEELSTVMSTGPT
ncbi:ammonia-forming cytochrome c nitrite reductase subunit c552 [uncultured Desulfuromusa sp.]|uniref:ammonia-forming cytochrome c nitrite reductase subunit c552 n=1 Tax=uncultured Desulfuromusa sp. TaxID=219183 RepID=UPI002AA87B4C|nr:ammonia-forming cytochrome c nitrite reductase subunit c552 [uncultured Desulfuromusa sp.]